MIYTGTQRGFLKHLLGPTLVLAGLLTWAGLLPGRAGLAFAQTARPSWSYTGNLKTARAGHTATLLPGGKVLIVGGYEAAGPHCGVVRPVHRDVD